LVPLGLHGGHENFGVNDKMPPDVYARINVDHRTFGFNSFHLHKAKIDKNGKFIQTHFHVDMVSGCDLHYWNVLWWGPGIALHGIIDVGLGKTVYREGFYK